MRANSVQLIRTTYDPEQKRGRNEVVGSVSRRTLALPDEVSAKLTPEEQSAFELFVTNYRNTKAMQAKVNAFQLPDIIQQVIEAVESSEGAEQEILIGNLTGAAQEIRSFLNKRQKAA